jgi:predicted enzyme related to lactoylglutathione lyase
VATKNSKRGGTAARSGKPAPKAVAAKPAARQAAPKPAAHPASKAPPAKKPAAKPAAPAVAAPPPVPNAMGLMSLRLDYTTHNYEEVRRFYTQQLGFTKFEHNPTSNYLWIHATNGSSLGFAPPSPRTGPPMMPREPVLYFIVKDVDEAYRKLQTRGVSFEGPPENSPWGHRVVITRDPEGRSIWIAQPKAGTSG